MLAGRPTQHSDPPGLASTAECLLRSPWLPHSTGASETLCQGQGKQSDTVSWRERSSCWKWQQPLTLAQRVLQRNDCGLKLSHGHCAECHCGFTSPPGTPTVGLGQCGQLLLDGLVVSQYPKNKYVLQIIPELFNPIGFYGTLRDFYFWLSTQQEMGLYRSLSTALTL